MLFSKILQSVAKQQGHDIGEEKKWLKAEKLNVPQQNNADDCGLFSLVHAIRFAKK
jgi:Ulp1 family protease